MKLREKFSSDVFYHFNLVQTAVTVVGALVLLLFMFVAAPGVMYDPGAFAKRGFIVAVAGGVISLFWNFRYLIALRSFSRSRTSDHQVPESRWPLIENAAYVLPFRLFILTLALWPSLLLVLGFWMWVSGLLDPKQAVRIFVCGLLYFPIQGLILFYFSRWSLRRLLPQLHEAGREVTPIRRRALGIREKLIVSFICLAALPLLSGLFLDGVLRERAEIQSNLTAACRALTRIHARGDGTASGWREAVAEVSADESLGFPAAFQVAGASQEMLAGEFSFFDRKVWSRELESELKPGECRPVPIPGTGNYLVLRRFMSPGVWISGVTSPVPEVVTDFRRYAFTFLMALFVIGLGVLTGYLTADSVADTVKGMAQAATKAAEGRYEPVAGMLLDDETADLAAGFNALVLSIHRKLHKSGEIIERVRSAIESLGRQSSSVRELAEKQREVIDEQSPLALQASSSAEEVSRAAAEIRDRAHHTQLQMEEVSKHSQTSETLLSTLAQLMEEISRGSTRVAGQMGGLELHLQRMEEVVQVIDDVADRTEMLALNAALEAAGHDEDKSRFAAVASEVQRISERISEETQTIKSLFDQIRTSSLDMFESIREGQAQAAEAPGQVQDLKQVLDRIQTRAMNAAGSMREITGMTGEQKKALDEMKMVVGEIRTMAEIMDQVSSGAENAAVMLAELSNKLRAAVRKDEDADPEQRPV